MRSTSILTTDEQERLRDIRMRLERDRAMYGDKFIGYWETSFFVDIIDRQRARIAELEKRLNR